MEKRIKVKKDVERSPYFVPGDYCGITRAQVVFPVIRFSSWYPPATPADKARKE